MTPRFLIWAAVLALSLLARLLERRLPAIGRTMAQLAFVPLGLERRVLLSPALIERMCPPPHSGSYREPAVAEPDPSLFPWPPPNQDDDRTVRDGAGRSSEAIELHWSGQRISGHVRIDIVHDKGVLWLRARYVPAFHLVVLTLGLLLGPLLLPFRGFGWLFLLAAVVNLFLGLPRARTLARAELDRIETHVARL